MGIKKLLTMAVFLTAGGLAQSAWGQVEPATDGVYYLYNKESGKFLSRGDNWGTRGIAEEYGLPWKVTIADGKYSLRMYDIVKAGNNSGLGSNSFTDNGSPLGFTLEGNTEGYKIKNGDKFLTAGDDNFVYVDGADANASVTWQFLTAEDFKSVIESKTNAQETAVANAAGIDLSETTLTEALSDYTESDFTSNIAAFPVKNGEWVHTPVPNRGGNYNGGSYGIEIYQGDGSLAYKKEGLPSGIYKVGIKAMQRTGSNAVCYAIGEEGYPLSSAYLSANGKTVQIKDWYSSRKSDANPNSTGEFVTIANEGGYYSEVYTYVGNDGVLDLKVSSGAYWGASWFLFNGVTLTYYSKVAEENVVEKSALNSAIAAAEALDVADAEEAALAEAVETAKDVLATATTKDELVNATTALNLAINIAKYEMSGANFMKPTADILVNGSFDTANQGWTLINMGYQQNGERPTRYAEKWNQGALSGSGSATQTIKNLPAGAYHLTAVVNAQLQSNQSLEITGVTLKVNDETINISGPWKGYEILYNHENDGDVTVTFTYNNTNANWVCVDQFSLVYGGDYDTYISDKAVLQYKKALGDAIAAANSFINNEKNVGTNVFQKSASAFGSYKAAVDEAQKVYDADGVVQEGYESAIATLENALETYKAVELNAPAAGTRYNVVLSYDGWTWNNMAITFKHDDRNDAGKYNIQYLVEPNPNYAQAIIFTKAEGVNRYTMSVMDVDGDQRYICTGVPHGGNTAQIRTTTTASDALVVEIRATNVEGKFNIYNTEANNYIGSQDAGVYTVNSHIDFNIVEAEEAEVALNIPAGKYATAMFPFKPGLPAGVKAYSCNKMNGDVLVLEEVTEPKANVPYILQNTNATDVEETVSGYGTAKQDEYTSGYLTASYATTGNYATGSYILQTQNGRQAFYLVVEEAPVPLTQYRARLNVPAAGAKAFFFGGDVTGINGVEGAEGATEVVRYNAAGVQVATPVKGLNIIKMSDGTVKKVMVK